MQRDAIVGADAKPDQVLAVAQAARRTVESVAAAERVRPFGEGGADVLPGEAVMGVAEARAVEIDLEAGDA